MSDPFAYYSDLRDRWPSFPDGQEDFADQLLSDASDMIRERWGDIDSRIDSGALAQNTVIRIVCGVAKRAMVSGDNEGVESESINTGPFGETRKFANPNGNLYLSAADIATLNGYFRPRARVGWLA